MEAAPAAGVLGTQLVNGHWYRVAKLKPRLREGLRLHVQRYRGQLWTVVEDRLNGRYHRLDATALRIIRLFDGQASLERLWLRLAAEPGEHTPSQDEILALLGQLHALDLLAADVLPDLGELRQRQQQQQRRQWRSRYLNPLAIRIALLDPDRWLARAVTVLAPLLSRGGALLWLALVLPALPLAALHWEALTHNAAEQMLALDNLVLIALLFPLVKALHEAGHGLLCKRFGGEVHDMGVMLLLFLPVPYVEASSSWTFADKRKRMLVAAAGMGVELGIAALAFYLWLVLEPGLARALAYDVAVLASVTTVVFNANPLLRYDGYYIASDALEIPNLAQRANRWWAWRVERHLLRRRDATSPVTAPGEGVWFALYAPLSFAYRLFVMVSIAMFVASQYFVLGLALAAWSVATGLGLPLLRALRWIGRVVGRKEAGREGRRAVLAALAAGALLVFALPLPHRTQHDGVLWLPERALLRVAQSGFVEELLAAPGQVVAPGDAVARLHDPALASALQVQAAREQAALARVEAARVLEPARAQQLELEWSREAGALSHHRARAERLLLRSEAAGALWLPDATDLPGRWLKEGQLLGYVLADEAPRVRVIVDQADADLLREAVAGRAEVRLPADPGRGWPAQVLRIVPAASTELPSPALGRQGGGSVPTDPRDESGRRALVSHFEVELALPADFPRRVVGSRVGVRLEHSPAPLAPRLWRAARRLFLTHFQA